MPKCLWVMCRPVAPCFGVPEAGAAQQRGGIHKSCQNHPRHTARSNTKTERSDYDPDQRVLWQCWWSRRVAHGGASRHMRQHGSVRSWARLLLRHAWLSYSFWWGRDRLGLGGSGLICSCSTERCPSISGRYLRGLRPDRRKWWGWVMQVAPSGWSACWRSRPRQEHQAQEPMP